MLFRRFLTLLIAGVGVVMLGGCAWNPVGVSDAKPEGEVVSATQGGWAARQIAAKHWPAGRDRPASAPISATISG